MTPQEISKINVQAYKRAGFLTRLLCRLRPYICPFDMLLEHVPHGASQFDIGCGNGVFLLLAKHYCHIQDSVGADVNEAALATADEAVESERVEFIMSIRPQEWPNKQFDVVSMIDVMHHVPAVQQGIFLEKACEKVKNGGKIIYKDMAKKPFFFAFMNRLHDLVLARQWITYFDKGEARQILKNQGFDITYETVRTCYWYRHELIVAQKIK
ncbi:class I SAM-dependent methyltransferase [Terasakiella sp. SH-1]|uniref:class I SAM-dependent methyltransferase n=1 Tax=Terasakiella sp. SH-1 TaxID=2560057 RepID=UPI001073C285|nr:class I SAM-dependent methyltransferase [Terasakiella sp. SH-1]